MRFLFLILAIGAVSDIKAQEWANLDRFADANIPLQTEAQVSGRVVFMGDSITEGWSGFYGEFFDGKPYINRGISGQTTPQMLVRFRADVLDLGPELVVILAGTNDIAGNTGPTPIEDIAGYVASMVELAQAHGIKVIVSSVLPAADYPWAPGKEPAQKIPALNQLLERYAEEKGIPYLDYFSAMTDGQNGLRAELTYDGVHPGRAGYVLMSELAEAAIAAAIR